MNRVIYYHDDLDGFTSAYLILDQMKAGKEPWTKYACRYGEQPHPDQLTYRRCEVWLVDFMFPFDVMCEMIETAGRPFVIIDHHESRADDVARLRKRYPSATIVFDPTKAACELVWEYLHPEAAALPTLVQYVADRDMWRNKLPNTKAVHERLLIEPMTMARWKELDGIFTVQKYASPMFPQRTGEWMSGAVAMLEYKNALVGRLAEGAIRRDFLGWKDIPVVNAPQCWASDVANLLAEKALFGVVWFQRGDGKFQYELRSLDTVQPEFLKPRAMRSIPDDLIKHGGIDVSKIAKEAGGGGHAHAAGFVADRLCHGEADAA